MVKDEIWSVSILRIRAFFQTQADVIREDTDTFTFPGCRIILTELEPRGKGIWKVSQTRLYMEGEDTAVADIHHRFFMQFLSAGG